MADKLFLILADTDTKPIMDFLYHQNQYRFWWYRQIMIPITYRSYTRICSKMWIGILCIFASMLLFLYVYYIESVLKNSSPIVRFHHHYLLVLLLIRLSIRNQNCNPFPPAIKHHLSESHPHSHAYSEFRCQIEFRLCIYKVGRFMGILL